MRISDWSSDVCSSDLSRRWRYRQLSNSWPAKLEIGARRKAARNAGRFFGYAQRLSGHRRFDWYRLQRSQKIITPALDVALHQPLHQLAVAFPSLLDTHVSRSEEHTSELQSLMRTSYAVFCLQKKK